MSYRRRTRRSLRDKSISQMTDREILERIDRITNPYKPNSDPDDNEPRFEWNAVEGKNIHTTKREIKETVKGKAWKWNPATGRNEWCD